MVRGLGGVWGRWGGDTRCAGYTVLNQKFVRTTIPHHPPNFSASTRPIPRRHNQPPKPFHPTQFHANPPRPHNTIINNQPTNQTTNQPTNQHFTSPTHHHPTIPSVTTTTPQPPTRARVNLMKSQHQRNPGAYNPVFGCWIPRLDWTTNLRIRLDGKSTRDWEMGYVFLL